ncbi:hypothetical protein DENSPDRAFT_832287 [Dentipellis sp. KUC8613]|nr:hypothetical protein DENSPDRAFT_832287 [Dentipellis sp. KUC8613]
MSVRAETAPRHSGTPGANDHSHVQLPPFRPQPAFTAASSPSASMFSSPTDPSPISPATPQSSGAYADMRSLTLPPIASLKGQGHPQMAGTDGAHAPGILLKGLDPSPTYARMDPAHSWSAHRPENARRYEDVDHHRVGSAPQTSRPIRPW